MEASQLLENVRFLHSDVTKQTIAVLEQLERVAKQVVDAAERVENTHTLHAGRNAVVAGQVDPTFNELIDSQVVRLEAMALTIKAAATEVNAGRSILHRENEKFLIDRVVEITSLIKEIKDVRAGMNEVVKRHTDQLITPLTVQMSAQIDKLAERNYLAGEYLKTTFNLYKGFSENMKSLAGKLKFAIAGVLLICIALFFSGFYLGRGQATVAADIKNSKLEQSS